MNKKANLILVSVGFLVLGIIALMSITVGWDLVQSQTNTSTVNEDLFTAINGTCVDVTENCIVSLTAVHNTSGTLIGSGNYSLCAVESGAGRYDGILLTNPTYGLSLNATYIESSCQRVTGTSGTILNYIPLLMAVVLLVGVAIYIKRD